MMPRRRRLIMSFVPLAVLLSAGSLFAHAVVFPKRAEPGAYEKYVLRVPNERAQPTTRVEIRFPAEVKVVSFGDVAGWSLDVVTDSAQRIIGAVWTGRLAPQRFVEFPFVAVNPKTSAQLVWPAFQTYADGERVEWTGPEGSDKPASVTLIGAATSGTAASGAASAQGTTTVAEVEDGADRGDHAMAVAAVAAVLAVIALGLALRKP
jgi:uncharacterized protein YcnI